MAEKSEAKTEFAALKAGISSGKIGNLYVFKGKEDYLREYYLTVMRKKVLGDNFEEFNYKRFINEKLTPRELSAAVDTLPVFSERTFIEVRDFDLFAEGEQRQNDIIALLSDIPEYCCLVFVYDTIEYKVGRAAKINAILKKFGKTVEFTEQSRSALFEWIDRRFAALGKEIGHQEKEYLVFMSGALMTGLISEIEKIAHHAKGKRITAADIDAAAVPIPEAVVFKMTDAISQKDYDKAAGILGTLLQLKEEPIKLLAIIGSQIRKLYVAKIALAEGRDAAYIKTCFEMKSSYPATLLMQSAKRFSVQWCRNAVELCAEYDFKMKSSSFDDEDLLKQLILEFALC